MERIPHELRKSLVLYMDDIIVIAPDFKIHMDRLEEVPTKLQTAALKLTPANCKLPQKQMKCLGHTASPSRAATDPDKGAAVRDWPAPKG